MPADSHHDMLLKAAIRDRPTVTNAGQPMRRLTDGVRMRPLPSHFDARGSVTELFDPRWDFHPDPFVFSYFFTIRPGVVKGWNLHERHEDRYALVKGELELVLYDPREGSPAFQEICVIRISEANRCLVTVPRNVWHADYNVGSEDLIVVNYPTMAYDHAAPDKLRLPIDTPLIPYRFPAGVHGG
jgi:dTDP-4-dehydrorhamnose 3,5-epimerase